MSATKRNRKGPAKPKPSKPRGKDESPRELILRVAGSNDGDPLTPRSADPIQVLPFAAAYLESLQAMAADDDEQLSVKGIEIRKGSVEFAFGVENLTRMQHLARQVARMMPLADAPPPIRRLRATVARLPEGVNAEVRIGAWKDAVISSDLIEQQPLRELTTFRGELLRVGGVRPAVRFRSDERDFSLEASKEQLRQLGKHLYHQVEVEAEVERDELGNIIGGRVLEVEIVTEGNALNAWQQWFNENSGDWDEASVEGFLDRNRD